MSNVTCLLKGHSGQPVIYATLLLKGHSGQPVINVTFLLKGHSGQPVSNVIFLLKGREIFTTPELVTAPRSILGPPSEGRPGVSMPKHSKKGMDKVKFANMNLKLPFCTHITFKSGDLLILAKKKLQGYVHSKLCPPTD